MKLINASGLVCYVNDIHVTVKFYELLGFTFKKHKLTHATGYINEFWIDFLQSDAEEKAGFNDEANAVQKGGGLFIYLLADNVDEVYQYLLEKGLKPSSEPKDWSWGNREFVIRDPDGYKLVIYKRNE